MDSSLISILNSPSENQILKFISYFRGPILYVMEIAVILSAGLRDWIDFGVIVSFSHKHFHSFLLLFNHMRTLTKCCAIIIDRYPHAERRGWLVSRKASR